MVECNFKTNSFAIVKLKYKISSFIKQPKIDTDIAPRNGVVSYLFRILCPLYPEMCQLLIDVIAGQSENQLSKVGS